MKPRLPKIMYSCLIGLLFTLPIFAQGTLAENGSSTNSKSTIINSKNDDHPNIVNIINFIRLLEPRDERITEEVLYETVVKQVEMMKKYELGGTLLLQYDALLDSRYQNF